MIKAIETSYAGHRFRSRTEARWAVFFDALGVRWEYEKEGYELPSGRYLPDFWLPQFGGWIEVKGERPTAHERALLHELMDGTGHLVALVTGPPDLEAIEAGMCRLDYELLWDDRRVELRKCIAAATRARFEHGEGVQRQPRLAFGNARRCHLYPMGGGDDWSLGETSPSGSSGGIVARFMNKFSAHQLCLTTALFADHECSSALTEEAA